MDRSSYLKTTMECDCKHGTQLQKPSAFIIHVSLFIPYMCVVYVVGDIYTNILPVTQNVLIVYTIPCIVYEVRHTSTVYSEIDGKTMQEVSSIEMECLKIKFFSTNQITTRRPGHATCTVRNMPEGGVGAVN